MSTQESTPAVEAAPTEAAAPVEAVEAPAVDTGAVEAPPAGTPEVPAGEAPPAAPEPPAWENPFSALDQSEVERAHRMYQAGQTEEGVIDLFIEAATTLGLSLEQVQALFGDPQEPAEEIDLDEPMTKGEWLEWQKQQAAVQQQTVQQQQIQVAAQAIDGVAKDLGLDPKDPSFQIVLNLGDQYLPDGSTDPKAVAEAVRRGHADYLVLIEKESKRVLEAKRAQAAAVPSAPAGAAAPAAEPPAEPMNVAEAIKAARKRLAG
jgi:hypothetical protein